MRCISRWKKAWVVPCLLAVALSGCGKTGLVGKYPEVSLDGNVLETSLNGGITSFSEELCVTSGDVVPAGETPPDNPEGLFSLDDGQVLYANKIFEKAYPASITKIMTALVFFENYHGDYSEVLTAGDSVQIDEPGAQGCGFAPGDQIPLEVALNGLLVYSGNDAANLIAEYVAGSVDQFVEKMNATARRLGATGTNFVNVHGLSDDQHYVTAYDIYLIFNEVMKYDKFTDLISTKNFKGEYVKASGNVKSVNWDSTNLYFTGDKETPANVTIVGGKTGTTKAAGSCLVLLSTNPEGKRYASIVMKAGDKATLYSEMSRLLAMSVGN